MQHSLRNHLFKGHGACGACLPSSNQINVLGVPPSLSRKSKQIIGSSLKYAEQGGISGTGLRTWSCTRTIGINKLRTTLQRLVLRSDGRVLRASACILHHSPSLRTKNMKSKPFASTLQICCKSAQFSLRILHMITLIK